MDNVIEKDRLKNHTVQRYRFKVLSSMKQEDDGEDIDQQEPVLDSGGKESCPEVKIDETQNQFVEELLKRSDTLSSNIVKLQMQIEKQESEFENRLKESLAREREISFNEGYEKAKRELEESYNERVANYIDSAKKFKEKIEEIDLYLKKLEKNLVDTSLEIAKEVIKKEIEMSSSKVAQSLAKELIEDLREANEITLKVNPKDFDMIAELFKENSKVKVESDSAISIGGVILLSEKGNLDGNISARLDKVRYLLQNE